MRERKLDIDIAFYVTTGIILYVINIILNVVDFYQRFGLDPWGYLGFLFFLTFNVFILYKIKKLRNWSRNLFIVKFFVFSIVFYSQALVLQSGSWMYSAHFPHGVFQHMSNIGNFVYELLFTIFLLKRNTRLGFKRA